MLLSTTRILNNLREKQMDFMFKVMKGENLHIVLEYILLCVYADMVLLLCRYVTLLHEVQIWSERATDVVLIWLILQGGDNTYL